MSQSRRSNSTRSDKPLLEARRLVATPRCTRPTTRQVDRVSASVRGRETILVLECSTIRPATRPISRLHEPNERARCEPAGSSPLEVRKSEGPNQPAELIDRCPLQ